MLPPSCSWAGKHFGDRFQNQRAVSQRAQQELRRVGRPLWAEPYRGRRTGGGVGELLEEQLKGSRRLP